MPPERGHRTPWRSRLGTNMQVRMRRWAVRLSVVYLCLSVAAVGVAWGTNRDGAPAAMPSQPRGGTVSLRDGGEAEPNGGTPRTPGRVVAVERGDGQYGTDGGPAPASAHRRPGVQPRRSSGTADRADRADRDRASPARRAARRAGRPTGTSRPTPTSRPPATPPGSTTPETTSTTTTTTTTTGTTTTTTAPHTTAPSTSRR
jgi:hypothetical protein